MKMGIIAPDGTFKEMPIYKIGEMARQAATVAEKNKDYKATLAEYRKNITRFNPEIEFIINELGFMIYDPLLKGKDEVLFSNGERHFIASTAFVTKEGFDRKAIRSEAGFPVLTDENMHYSNVLDENKIIKGIIDERGYLDFTPVKKLNALAEIILMDKLFDDVFIAEDYMKNKDKYKNALDYVTSKDNTLAIRKEEDGKFNLQYVSDNNEVISSFLKKLESEGKISDQELVVQADTSLM